jgi:hypothetical protein
VTYPAVLLEIEETVFDTLDMRVRALCSALRSEGVMRAVEEVRSVHTGVTAAMAVDAIFLDALSVDTMALDATALDATALNAMRDSAALDVVTRDLVLLRAADNFRAALSTGRPSFDSAARDAVERLAAEFRISVVSRASCEDAQRMLEESGLDMCIRSVHSFGDLPQAEHRTVWADAATRLHGGPVIAIGPRGILEGARQCGLLTIAIGPPTTQGGTELVSLANLDASLVASLPEKIESS